MFQGLRFCNQNFESHRIDLFVATLSVIRGPRTLESHGCLF